MRKALLSTLTFCLCFTVSSQTFNPLNSGVGNLLSDLDFVGNDLGLAVGNGGTIVRTVNGGANWTTITSGVSSDLSDVAFFNQDTAIITGRNGVLLRSINAGVSWSPVSSGVGTDLSRVFVNGNDIYVSGYSGILLKSTDAGVSWFPLNSGTSTHLFQLYFTSATVGYVVGNSATILKTTNGGTSWTPLDSDISTVNQLLGVHFTDANNGYAVGGHAPSNEGVILRTTNGGTTWTSQTFSGNFFLTIRFLDATTGYTIGGNVANNTSTILKTTNAGANWNIQNSNSFRQVGSCFPSSEVGYTCGLNGSILKTIITGPVYGPVQTEEACESYTWPQTNTTYTSSGVYYDTIASASGNDSILTLDLTIHSGYEGDESVTLCGDSYTWPVTNVSYTVSGDYPATFQNEHGCDSVIVLHLELFTPPEAIITASSEGVLVGSAAGSYATDWIDCATGQSIPSQEGQPTFSPEVAGDYAVVLYNPQTGCSDTSDCFRAGAVGLDEFSTSGILISPNPATETIFLSFDASLNADNLVIELSNATGERIHTQQNADPIAISGISSGIYFLTVRSGDRSWTKKVIKE